MTTKEPSQMSDTHHLNALLAGCHRLVARAVSTLAPDDARRMLDGHLAVSVRTTPYAEARVVTGDRAWFTALGPSLPTELCEAVAAFLTDGLGRLPGDVQALTGSMLGRGHAHVAVLVEIDRGSVKALLLPAAGRLDAAVELFAITGTPRLH